MSNSQFDSSDGQRAFEACPSFVAAMDVVGRRWNGLIIGAVAKGCSTFGEIQRYAATLSDTVLARRLRELEADGLITRRVLTTRPPSVRYALTPSGEALAPILDELTQWGQQFYPTENTDSLATEGERA